MYCVLCILWCILWASGPEINVILSYLILSMSAVWQIGSDAGFHETQSADLGPTL